MSRHLVEATEMFKKIWIVDTFNKNSNIIASIIRIDQYSSCEYLFEVEYVCHYCLHYMSQ
jgi:hypothetical protein